MTINLTMPDIRELRPRITVFGVGGAGGNAVNNMISAGLQGVDFVVANTDAQALTLTKAERMIQMGVQVTEGLGAGSQPDVGRAAAEEVIDEIRDHLSGAHMVFVTAGMGGGTGTGAAPVIAQAAKEMGILTVGVVTKPFHFEGARRMRTAEAGISSLQSAVDTLLIIPNQNLFRVANEKTTFADAFAMADQVLYSGVACITDLMVKEGLINLDFADVRAVMREMGKAMMGTGEASGEKRALRSAEAAISNPLIDDVSMKGARGLLVSITGGRDLTLYEVDEAATRIREEVDSDANIIVGATFDESLEGIIRVSVVATGIDLAIQAAQQQAAAAQVVEQVQQRVIRPVAQAPRLPERKIETIQQQVAAAPIPHADPAIEFAPVEHHQPAQLHEDVTIRPLEIKAAPAMESHEHAPAAFEPPQRAFIPPAAERPVVRPRMPRIDELPPQAQAQIRAHRDQVPQEKPRMGLLQRLAQVGLSGLREPQADSAPQAAQPVQRTAEPVAPMPQRAAETRLPEQVAHYAPRPVAQRPAHQGLDHHGRAPAPQAASEDDQLEIPAFLRRQVK